MTQPMTPKPETPHTPGPWKLGTAGMIWTVGDPYGHGVMKIADMRGWGHLTGQGACAFDEDKAAAIQDATGLIVAAAPELYEALKAHGRHPSKCPKGVGIGLYKPPDDAVCACGIDAAIAKAEGRR